MVSLPAFPIEILDEVMSHLPSQFDQHSAMRSCRSLHWPAARYLYRDVSVSDYSARRLFKTITESNLRYDRFVKKLEYKASTNTDIYLTHLLLCDAIPKLELLEHLMLSVRSALSLFLIYILKRSVSDPDRPQVISDHYFYTPRADIDKTLMGLSKLRTFRLNGNIRLLNITSCHRMEKIAITDLITFDEFTYFMEKTAPHNAGASRVNPRLKELTITLAGMADRRIIYAIFVIGLHFPKLRQLSIRGICLNAVDISQMMTLEPPLFPELQRLEINQISLIMPDEFFIREGKAMDIQLKHAIKAGHLRPSLQCMTFGTIAWERVPKSDTWEELYQPNATGEDLDMLPENFSAHPLQWAVEFRQPIELTELQSFYSKQNLDDPML